ncbi:MAG: anti-sigma factor antagonist [Candidatus Omnitrophica bacterium]|nr:anti-sigma factor antagonist [Candidatus Omnitrophota bacterium]
MMEIRKRFQDNVVILYITGDIDINSAALIEETGQYARQGIDKILLNITNVNIIDYNGLSIMNIAYKNVVNQKGMIKFCMVPAHVKSLFATSGLDKVFEIYDIEEEAIKSFECSSTIDRIPMRRRFERIEVRLSVKYKTSLSSTAKMQAGIVQNLGGEGIFIHSKDTHPVSTQLYVELSLEEAKPLTLRGTVIWLADKKLQPHLYPGMGVQLVHMDSLTQEKIIKFIDRHITHRSRI